MIVVGFGNYERLERDTHGCVMDGKQTQPMDYISQTP